MKKPSLALGLLIASLPLFAQAKDLGTLRIGVEGAYPPFSEVGADGKLVGLDIDLANAVCAEIKARCVLIQNEFDGMIPALQAKKIDAVVASMAITEERKQKVDFTNRYYSTPQRMIARKGGSLKDLEAASLNGKKVGVQRGTNSEVYARRFFEPQGVQVVIYGKQDEVYLDLASGRIDGAFTDGLEAQEGFLKRKEGQEYQFVGQALYGKTSEEKAIIGEGAGIALRKGDQELKAKLNKALATLRQNGSWDKIRSKYFDYDIYAQDSR